MQENKKRGTNIGSVIGWLIFVLVVAGGPLLNLLRSALGSKINLPSNLLPMLIGGLVVLSILVSVVRAAAGSRRNQSDTRLPTGNAPMPPFAGPAAPRIPPRSTLPQTYAPSARNQQLPSAPRFEPVLNLKIIVIGIVGVLLLLAGAALLLGFALP